MGIISHGNQQPESLSEASADANVQMLRDQLEQFELGRFLKANLGLNGFWTSYVLLHPQNGQRSRLSSDGTPLCPLESWLLEKCPILLATQERFEIFRRITQPHIKAGMHLASIPSGLMDDLLSLDYSQTENVHLTAVDLDQESLDHARVRYERFAPPVAAAFEQRDAWNLESPMRWDLITSNGLNIYVDDNQHCIELYRSIARSLRPNGLFVCSFITPVQQWQPFDPADLERQRHLFSEVLPVKWQCTRDEAQTRAQLNSAGMNVLSVHYDKQRMFPAVVATPKP